MQWLRGIFFKKDRFPLKDIVLYLTFNCNLRCTMCPLWGRESPQDDYDPALSRRILTREVLFQLIDDASPYLPTFLLSGGEPLMHPHWEDIARYIQKKRLHCNLQSNGHYLKRAAPRIVELFQFVNISIDGLASHDTIRGEKGSLDTILTGLYAFQEAKNRVGKRRPYLNICMTLGPENAKEAAPLLTFLERKPFDISSVVLMQRELNSFSPYDDATILQLADAFESARQVKTSFPVLFRPDENRDGLLRYLREPKSYSKRTFRACPHPYYEIFVQPDGSVWTCPSTQVGSLLDEPFASMWTRVRRQAFQESLFQTLALCKSCQGEVFMYAEGAKRMVSSRGSRRQAPSSRVTNLSS